MDHWCYLTKTLLNYRYIKYLHSTSTASSSLPSSVLPRMPTGKCAPTNRTLRFDVVDFRSFPVNDFFGFGTLTHRFFSSQRPKNVVGYILNRLFLVQISVFRFPLNEDHILS